MRYNVHSPCAFHNRIAKSLGVLVGAALVATLGLPTAAGTDASGADGDMGRYGNGLAPAAPLLQRGGGAAAGDGRSADRVAGRIYRAWRTMGRRDAGVRRDKESTAITAVRCYLANDPRIHHGVWKFRVSYWDICHRRRRTTTA